MRLMFIAFACACAPALAQGPYIEVGYQGTFVSSQSGDVTASVQGTFVFDAAAAPVSSDGSTVSFMSVSGSAFDATISPFTPIQDDPDPVPVTGLLTYDVAADWWEIQIVSGGALSGIRVQPPTAGFGAGMTSLPDDPEDWLPDPGASQRVDVDVGFVSITWTSGGGHSSGWLGYWVREVDAPVTCTADLDGNGVLNVDDIDAFVDAFLGGCP